MKSNRTPKEDAADYLGHEVKHSWKMSAHDLYGKCEICGLIRIGRAYGYGFDYYELREGRIVWYGSELEPPCKLVQMRRALR